MLTTAVASWVVPKVRVPILVPQILGATKQ